jgi:hypothetical protein
MPPPVIYGQYMTLGQINITPKDDEDYTDAGTTLEKGI